MQNRKLDWLLIFFGLVFGLIVFKIMSLGNLFLTLIPLFAGALYVLFGLGILPLGKKIRIILVWFFLPFLAVYMMSLNELLENNVVGGRTSWYTQSGVCTEATWCFLVGQGLFFLFSIVSGIVGLAKLFVTPKSNQGSSNIVH